MPRTGLTAEQIKEKALEAALMKMREVGFEKVRLTEIAKELGVSHAALYAHFRDKSDLLDAVSQTWLEKLDEDLESICRERKDPCEKIHAWALAIHRAKVAKVRSDPEPYNAFDLASQQLKPFIRQHLENLRRQLTAMVKEAIEQRRLAGLDPEEATAVIGAAVLPFHHPRLVALYIDEPREALLDRLLDSVLKGLNLKQQ